MYFLRFSLNFIAQRTKALALQQESCENYFNPKQSDAKNLLQSVAWPMSPPPSSIGVVLSATPSGLRFFCWRRRCDLSYCWNALEAVIPKS
jgi:hypothetical protein